MTLEKPELSPGEDPRLKPHEQAARGRKSSFRTIDGAPIATFGDFHEALKKGLLTENQTRTKVFGYLAGIDEDWVVYYGTIAKDLGITVTQARNAVRKLVRDGMAEHVHGLIDGDGMAAGSGHRLTQKGFKHSRGE